MRCIFAVVFTSCDTDGVVSFAVSKNGGRDSQDRSVQYGLKLWLCKQREGLVISRIYVQCRKWNAADPVVENYVSVWLVT